MIVKVQLSITTNAESGRTVMIYDEDQNSLFFQCDADESIIKLMGGELKKFFHAEIKGEAQKDVCFIGSGVKASNFIDLQGEAPWQEW